MNIFKRVLLLKNLTKNNSYKVVSANNYSSSPDLIFTKKPALSSSSADKENRVSSSEKADNISRAMTYYLEKLNERGITIFSYQRNY